MNTLKKKIIESNTDTELTTVFLLHGYGSNLDDLISLSSFLPKGLKIVSFQAPYELDNFGLSNSYAWFPLHLQESGDIGYDMDKAINSVEIVKEEIKKELGNNKDEKMNKPIVIGFSQGAMITHALGIQNPNDYLGIAPLSGRMITELFNESTNKNIDQLDVFVSHGIYDDVINVSNADEINTWYQKHNAKILFNKYNMGHEINHRCLTDLSQWMSGLIKAKNINL